MSKIRDKVIMVLFAYAVLIAIVVIANVRYGIVVPYSDHIVFVGGGIAILFCLLLQTTFRGD